MVLLGDELLSGLETGDEDCLGLAEGQGRFSFIGPPKMVGAKEVCLTGEDESSARARGLKPVF